MVTNNALIREDSWREQMHHAGLRVTKQRLAVLATVQQHPHAAAEDVLKIVSEQLAGITLQSVYTVIGSLVDAGILRKLELPGSPARFELEHHDNHHHALCRSCGQIEDVACATGAAPCLHPSEDHGMTIEVADVIYQGLCKNCQGQNRTDK